MTDRESELAEAFVEAWEASGHTPFDFHGGSLVHPAWPETVSKPGQEEVRALHHKGALEVDRDAAPVWRVFPSPACRREFGGADEVALGDGLADPDRRLGIILEATVAAFEADPGEPIHFAPMEQTCLVHHPHWSIAPDVVREHDLQQLVELGLISVSPRGRDSAFWPTPDGRAAVHDPAGLLDRRANQAEDELDGSRLRKWASRVRTGDIAVGAAGGITGAAIRALVGL
jgi:hypothetical protein